MGKGGGRERKRAEQGREDCPEAGAGQPRLQISAEDSSDSAGGRAVNHRVLGTGQRETEREREQLLSATLPAIREPALAHGHTPGAAARRFMRLQT